MLAGGVGGVLENIYDAGQCMMRSGPIANNEESVFPIPLHLLVSSISCACAGAFDHMNVVCGHLVRSWLEGGLNRYNIEEMAPISLQL